MWCDVSQEQQWSWILLCVSRDMAMDYMDGILLMFWDFLQNFTRTSSPTCNLCYLACLFWSAYCFILSAAWRLLQNTWKHICLGRRILDRARTFEFVLHFVKCDTVAVSPTQIIIIIIIMNVVFWFPHHGWVGRWSNARVSNYVAFCETVTQQKFYPGRWSCEEYSDMFWEI